MTGQVHRSGAIAARLLDGVAAVLAPPVGVCNACWLHQHGWQCEDRLRCSCCGVGRAS